MPANTELDITYETFKSVRGGLPVYYVHFPSSNEYSLFCIADSFIYVCRLLATDVVDFEANLKSAATKVGSKRDAVALASVIGKSNRVKPRTADGKDLVSIWPTEGSKVTLITPNWCDPTTWYYRAVRVVQEVATVKTPGVYSTYKLSRTNIIDTYHGKISAEDFLKDASSNSYRVVVTVNNVQKTEQDPHVGSGGDYTVNYAAGEVSFLSVLTSNDTVRVTYHYATTSEWLMRPDAGRVLKIRKVEVQFSDDIVLTDSVVFQPYGPVDIWAPGLTPSPYPSGTMIPLGDPDVMKTMMDYVNDANGAFPQLPALGGQGWRGMKRPIHVFQWDYQSVTDMVSSRGVEIRLKLAHDIPFGGSVATATFYCLSERE